MDRFFKNSHRLTLSALVFTTTSVVFAENGYVVPSHSVESAAVSAMLDDVKQRCLDDKKFRESPEHAIECKSALTDATDSQPPERDICSNEGKPTPDPKTIGNDSYGHPIKLNVLTRDQATSIFTEVRTYKNYQLGIADGEKAAGSCALRAHFIGCLLKNKCHTESAKVFARTAKGDKLKVNLEKVKLGTGVVKWNNHAANVIYIKEKPEDPNSSAKPYVIDPWLDSIGPVPLEKWLSKFRSVDAQADIMTQFMTTSTTVPKFAGDQNDVSKKFDCNYYELQQALESESATDSFAKRGTLR